MEVGEVALELAMKELLASHALTKSYAKNLSEDDYKSDFDIRTLG
jgi:hypothetical protein